MFPSHFDGAISGTFSPQVTKMLWSIESVAAALKIDALIDLGENMDQIYVEPFPKLLRPEII